MRTLSLESKRFRREWAEQAPRGTPAHASLIRVLGQLCRDPILPGPDDLPVGLPMSVMSRAVPGTPLWVAYVAGGDVVTPIALFVRA